MPRIVPDSMPDPEEELRRAADAYLRNFQTIDEVREEETRNARRMFEEELRLAARELEMREEELIPPIRLDGEDSLEFRRVSSGVNDITFNLCRCATCRSTRSSFATNSTFNTRTLEWEDNERSFDAEGYDSEDFDRDGFNRDGYNRDGYDRDGFNRNGLNRAGYNRTGFNYWGFNRDGFNSDGYNEDGYDRLGYDREGYDLGGRDREGYNYHGFNREGFNHEGNDVDGYNKQGIDRDGNERPCTCTDCRNERGELLYLAAWFNPFEYEDGNSAPSGGYRDVYGDWVEPYGSEYIQQPHEVLRNYSYTPQPLTFRRVHGEDEKKALYLGMEIEMTSRLSPRELATIKALGHDEKLLYAKQDGSVHGFEMVSHPMTAKWAQANFPWHVVEDLAVAGASVDTRENGLHIHVSRAGFADEAHQYRWLKLWYKNECDVVRIAGRDGAGWGEFDPDQRLHHGVHLKDVAKARHGKRSEPRRSAGDRYSALNLQNENTIEVRIFASTTSADTLRTRFELVASTVEYTRKMSVREVKAGWTWGAYRKWLTEHAEEYPAIALNEARAAAGRTIR